MTEEQSNKVAETESTPSNPSPAPQPKEDVAEEKTVIPQPSPPDNKPAADQAKALVTLEKTSEVAEEKPLEGSVDRDAVLARVATEKRLSLIKAWEESAKSRAENKSHKKLSVIAAWENRKKALAEAELRKIEEQLEKKKAEHAEKLKNKIATIHQEAEEKRAFIEARRGEDFLKAEETAAKYRATGTAPKKLFRFF
ncbi:hypothetical protein VNO78_19802 [Psophocarpus tetragonolobus]|uniref:Remorin n=1 Tax=Psophocarpus tetragonolobus TaxID=3891 RepID=A0AAN9XGL1_PSOTE